MNPDTDFKMLEYIQRLEKEVATFEQKFTERGAALLSSGKRIASLEARNAELLKTLTGRENMRTLDGRGPTLKDMARIEKLSNCLAACGYYLKYYAGPWYENGLNTNLLKSVTELLAEGDQGISIPEFEAHQK